MAEDQSRVGSEESAAERALTIAANYYIRNRRPISDQNEKSRNYLIDLNITLLESTAEAHGLSVEDLDKKVKEIDLELAKVQVAQSQVQPASDNEQPNTTGQNPSLAATNH